LIQVLEASRDKAKVFKTVQTFAFPATILASAQFSPAHVPLRLKDFQLCLKSFLRTDRQVGAPSLPRGVIERIL
jgi:hypothetical protein